MLVTLEDALQSARRASSSGRLCDELAMRRFVQGMGTMGIRDVDELRSEAARRDLGPGHRRQRRAMSFCVSCVVDEADRIANRSTASRRRLLTTWLAANA